MIKKITIAAVFFISTLFIFYEPVKNFTVRLLPYSLVEKLVLIKKIMIENEDPPPKPPVQQAENSSLTYAEVTSFFNAEFTPSTRKTADSLSYVYYDIPDIFPGKHAGAKNSAYIDLIDNGIMYVSANGVFTYINSQAYDSCFKLNNVKSNIRDIVSFSGFYEESWFGIKDIFIEDSIIYISCTLKKEGGYNTSILSAKMDTEKLVFSPLFVPDEFIKADNDSGLFNAHQSGGRISKGRQDSLLFTIGDYDYREKAQSDQSVNGKIISVSKEDGGYRIVSKGHRNPQGLDFHEDLKLIISTEHGPSGGDEININRNMDVLANFGWPISSYGYHYGRENIDSPPPDGGPGNWKLQGSPLYKSHSKYGFEEPLLYFEKNPGISEVEILSTNYSNNEMRIAVATMGYDWALEDRPFARSILIYNVQLENDSVKLVDQFKVDERVRDLIFNKDKNQLIFVGETSGLVGFIDLLES